MDQVNPGRPMSRLLSVLVLLLLLVSTAGAVPPPRTRSATPIESRSPTPRQADGRERITEPLRRGERISLDLKDADLVDVVRSFAELARINLAVDPEVRGSVTVRLENVEWERALELILRQNGLGYVLEGNVLRVGMPEKLVR
jgi:type II secretory pathway component GspD/PulD (secretin)